MFWPFWSIRRGKRIFAFSKERHRPKPSKNNNSSKQAGVSSPRLATRFIISKYLHRLFFNREVFVCLLSSKKWIPQGSSQSLDRHQSVLLAFHGQNWFSSFCRIPLSPKNLLSSLVFNWFASLCISKGKLEVEKIKMLSNQPIKLSILTRQKEKDWE